MSGELDTRPDLVEQIRELRDKVRDLESRVNGDESGFDLSDLNDVRVDSMVDGGVTLVDGSTLVYRSSDDIWVAGAGSGDSFWQYGVTDTNTLDVAAATEATMDEFFVRVNTAAGLLGLRVNDTQPLGGGAGDYEIGVTLGKFGPLTGAGGTPLAGTLDLTTESLTTGAYSEMFMQSDSNVGFRGSDQISANGNYEAYHDQFADNTSAWFEFIAIGPSNAHFVDLDVVSTDGLVYVNIFGRNDAGADPFILFGSTGSDNKFDAAPDASLVYSGQWSLGYDQGTNTFTIKVNDGGSIKTWTMNPT